MFDWQAIAVALIILAALIYTGRRALSRLRSFRARQATDASCETGCGTCGSNEQKTEPATPRTVFVEISRSRTSQRNR